MSAGLVHIWCIKLCFKDTIVVRRNHRYSDSLRGIFKSLLWVGGSKHRSYRDALGGTCVQHCIVAAALLRA